MKTETRQKNGCVSIKKVIFSFTAGNLLSYAFFGLLPFITELSTIKQLCSFLAIFSILFYLFWFFFLDVFASLYGYWHQQDKGKQYILLALVIISSGIVFWLLMKSPPTFSPLNSTRMLMMVLHSISLLPTAIVIVCLGSYLVFYFSRRENQEKIYDLLERTIKNIINTISKNRLTVVLIILFAIIAYGVMAFNILLIADDWRVIGNSMVQYDWVIQTGRWMARLIWSLAKDNTTVSSFSVFFLVCMQLISALIITRILNFRKQFAVLVFACVMIFHPIWVNSVLQKMTHIVSGTAILAASILGYLMNLTIASFLDKRDYKKGIGTGILSAVLFCLIASANQIFILYAIIITLASILINILDDKYEKIFKEIGSSILILLAIVLVGLILYFIGIDVSTIIYSVEETPEILNYQLAESLVTSFGELCENISSLSTYLRQLLFLPQSFIPGIIKYIHLLFILSLLLLPIIGKSHKINLRKRTVTIAVCFILIFLVIFIMPWGFSLIRKCTYSNYKYSTLRPISLVYAVISGIVIERAGKTSAKRNFLSLLAIIIIAVFLFQHASAAYILYNYNIRDRAIANRILLMIEEDPDYSMLDSHNDVIIKAIGTPDVITDQPFSQFIIVRPMYYPLASCGIFNCMPNKHLGDVFHLIQYDQTTYIIERISSLDVLTETELGIYESMELWPNQDSIVILDNNTILIVFSKVF